MNGENVVDEITNDNRLSKKAKTVLAASQLIKFGKPVNIDNLAISEEDKQGLREFQQECASKGGISQLSKKEQDELNETLFWASLFWVVVIGLIIWLVIRWRRKRKEQKLKENK